MPVFGQNRTFQSGTEFMLQALKALLAVLLASHGDLRYGRSLICVIGGICVVAFVYWLALPHDWTLWPAVLVVLFSGAIGLLWEDRASTNSKML